MLSEQAADIFLKARTLDIETRAEYVTEACGDSKELRDAVESLLAASNDSEAYFEKLTEKVSLDALMPDDDVLPAQKVIGSWRLLRQIGRGGMGAVYLAERADEQFEQQAALKILPTGLDTDQARARFLVERQILARLAHDNIARLLDGGVTDDGVPYFVMDYVDGLPIDTYCEENRLGVRQKLALVLDIARAVQFAHRNLIIHRDLKPNNVLIDTAGHVRLLDFGIAKMLFADSVDRQLTQETRRPVTPAYSSPEMLRGEPVDVTTDVYSIGALIYTLLTGRAPLSFDGLSITDMYDRATNEEPEPIGQCDARFKGDLETIVAKALAKEPEERYESVESLANDLRNYLYGLPVSAQPPTAYYRVRKFVGRHRLGVAFSVFAVAALASIAALATWSAIQSDNQAHQIERERDRAEQTIEFMVSIFESADPNIVPEEQTARQILEAGRTRIEQELAGQPQVQADLLHTMNSVYRSWRMPLESREVLTREIELRESVNDTNSKEYVRALYELAVNADIAGDYDASLDYAKRVLDFSASSDDVMGQAQGHERIGRIHHLRGDLDVAGTHYRQARDLTVQEKGGSSIEVAYVMEHLGNLYIHQQDFENALNELQTSLDIRQQQIDGDHAELSSTLLAIGSAHLGLKQFDDAHDAYRSGYDMNDRLYGEDNSYNMYFANGLGKVAEARGDYDDAAALYDETARLINLHTPDSPNLGFAVGNAARILAHEDRCDLAAPKFERAAAIFVEKLPTHPELGDIKWRHGLCLVEAGEYRLAEPLILAGLEVVESRWGPDSDRAVGARAAAATLYAAWGKPRLAANFEPETDSR